MNKPTYKIGDKLRHISDDTPYTIVDIYCDEDGKQRRIVVNQPNGDTEEYSYSTIKQAMENREYWSYIPVCNLPEDLFTL